MKRAKRTSEQKAKRQSLDPETGHQVLLLCIEHANLFAQQPSLHLHLVCRAAKAMFVEYLKSVTTRGLTCVFPKGPLTPSAAFALQAKLNNSAVLREANFQDAVLRLLPYSYVKLVAPSVAVARDLSIVRRQLLRCAATNDLLSWNRLVQMLKRRHPLVSPPSERADEVATLWPFVDIHFDILYAVIQSDSVRICRAYCSALLSNSLIAASSALKPFGPAVSKFPRKVIDFLVLLDAKRKLDQMSVFGDLRIGEVAVGAESFLMRYIVPAIANAGDAVSIIKLASSLLQAHLAPERIGNFVQRCLLQLLLCTGDLAAADQVATLFPGNFPLTWASLGPLLQDILDLSLHQHIYDWFFQHSTLVT